MIRLLYLSNDCKHQNESGNHLREILEESQKNNLAQGITGILIHGGGMYLQVIEGPQEKVLRQYVKILDDKRHSDCKIVLISTIQERAFPKWSMASLELATRDFQDIQEMINHSQQIDTKWFREIIALFIKKTLITPLR